MKKPIRNDMNRFVKAYCDLLAPIWPIKNTPGAGNTASTTSFMIISKFSPVFVAMYGDRRFLFTPPDKVQLAYLRALEVHPAVFTDNRLNDR
jgi:hypothetical protein